MAKNKDNKFMLRALALAKRGFGRTSPNPMVGALIVKNGRIIGEGYHHKAGSPHAEINAIDDAGKDACRGATIYVTLEPCSSSGRTPPCTKAIIAAKFAKVIIGCQDPNPSHNGKAVKLLKKAGISTVTGVEEKKCLALNESFFHWIQTGRPLVLLKMAMTIDGKIATAEGKSKWITGPVARRRVQQLRKWADAIMVGSNTLKTDHPSLTVRSTKFPQRELRNWKQPERIVASNSLTATQAAQLLTTGKKPIVVKAETRAQWLRVLKNLGKKDITALLVEGGGELAASVLQAGVVDKVEFHIAPKILGGRKSRPVISGKSPADLSEAMQLKDIKIKKLGDDICISGDIKSENK